MKRRRDLNCMWMLRLIVWSLHKRGYAPTVTEIAELFDCTTPYVSAELNILADEGYIQRGKGWRDVRVLRLP